MSCCSDGTSADVATRTVIGARAQVQSRAFTQPRDSLAGAAVRDGLVHDGITNRLGDLEPLIGRRTRRLEHFLLGAAEVAGHGGLVVARRENPEDRAGMRVRTT